MNTTQQHQIWRVVDNPQQQPQQQIVYVQMGGPEWLQVLATAPPQTVIGLAALGGVVGGVAVASLLVLAVIVTQFVFGLAVIAGVLALSMVAIMAMFK